MLIALAFPLAVFAQAGEKLSRHDRSFISQATNGGRVEIELSRIALQGSATPAIKAYARQIVEDHEKAGKELDMIASKLGATPPKPNLDKQGDMRRFAELSGDKLDHAYIERMVRDHKGAIALFEMQAKKGDAQELKAFAGDTLPTLKEHLKMAMALAEKQK